MESRLSANPTGLVTTMTKPEFKVMQMTPEKAKNILISKNRNNRKDLAIYSLQTPSLYRVQGSPCVVILPCKDPVKITGYHSNPSSYVVGT